MGAGFGLYSESSQEGYQPTASQKTLGTVIPGLEECSITVGPITTPRPEGRRGKGGYWNPETVVLR